MRRHLGLLVALVALVVTCVAARARAEEGQRRAPALPEGERPPLGLFPTPRDALMDPTMARSWATAPRRWFVATAFDVGFVYVRPRVSVGWGRPFTLWTGLDLNPIVTSNGLGLYAGVRGAMPHLDLRVGSREFQAFSHSYLPTKESYDRLDLESRTGSRARVVTHEIEADTDLPLGPGQVLLRGSASYLKGVPPGDSVFEETLRVIVKPPFVWRFRGGYALTLGSSGQHSLGVVVDVLDVPKRDDSVTVRVGPILRLVLSRRVEVRGSFVVPVLSPDRLGLVTGDFTELGVRYRWATE